MLKKFISKLFRGEEADRFDVALTDSDYFVVSYPKSGNTWTRFLLANALLPEVEVNFHSIHRLIPDLHKEDENSERIKDPKIFKSHRFFDPTFKNVIYIVRDGRDVYTSFFYYKKANEHSTLLDFIREREKTIGSWSDHVRSWIDRKDELDSFLLVKYEDLLKDAGEQLRRMLNFIDVNIEDERRIEQAVLNSSFRAMKEIENKKGRAYQDKEETEQFIRKGISGDWKNHFSEREKKYFKRKEGKLLVELGYENDNDW